MRGGARAGRAGPALAGALALLLAPAPGRGMSSCADACGNGQCQPGSTVIINGVDCMGGGGGGRAADPSVHCTEESLEKEHSFVDNAMPTTFSFKGLGCECVEGKTTVHLSCPSGADASNGDLGKAIDFRYAELPEMKFNGANLKQAKFDYAACQGCSFVGAEMSGTDMSYARMSDSSFFGADLEGASLDYMNFDGGNFTAANMEDANADCGSFKGASFAGATMSNLDGDYGHFNKADLSDAVLEGADLSYARMEGADLSRANFEGADLSFAGLRGSTGFQSATCSGATFDFMTCPSGTSVGVLQNACDPGESCLA